MLLNDLANPPVHTAPAAEQQPQSTLPPVTMIKPSTATAPTVMKQEEPEKVNKFVDLFEPGMDATKFRENMQHVPITMMPCRQGQPDPVEIPPQQVKLELTGTLKPSQQTQPQEVAADMISWLQQTSIPHTQNKQDGSL